MKIPGWKIGETGTKESIGRKSRERREVNQWVIVWHRFKKSKTGLIGLVFVTTMVFTSIFASFAPYDPNDTTFFIEGLARTPPSWEHLFGVDRLGRDEFSRVLYGGRNALMVGLGTAGIAALLGITIGGFAGFYGKKVDELLMRFADVFLVMPIYLILLLAAKMYDLAVRSGSLGALGQVLSTQVVIIMMMSVFSWPRIARLTRAQFLKVKEEQHVEAARCLGASNWKIMFRHIFPNASPPIIAIVTSIIATSILWEVTISFLGFGDPLVVSWGQMLSFAKETMKTDWWSALFPGLAIFVTTLGFNLLGDALNDALNPRLK